MELIGIYEFDGSLLTLHFRVRRNSIGPDPVRPNSFKNEPGPAFSTPLRLRRVRG
jgi:hypothetical protein